jgi:hypothetical protein
MHSNWLPEHENFLKKVWGKHKDKEGAHLILDKLGGAFLEEHFEELKEVLYKAGLNHISRLFVKANSLEKAQQLLYIDEITYVYVCAKIGSELSPNYALEIFEKNKLDERVGLLLWSFGELGLWEVLTNIAGRIDELNKERIRSLRERYSIES